MNRSVVVNGLICMMVLLFTAACSKKESNSNGSASNKTYSEIIMKGFEYHPSVMTNRTGEPVIWVNQGETSHNLNISGNGTNIQSGLIIPTKSYAYIFRTTGVYTITDLYHPKEHGTVVIITNRQ